MVFAKRHPLEHDKQVIAVILDLGTLVGVQDIFQHQRVQAETLSEPLQQRRFMQPVDVDPGHGPGRPRATLLHRAHFLLGERLLVVLHERHAAALAFTLADVN